MFTKSFKSKKEALKQNKIYVFCPNECVSNIVEIINAHSFELVINDFSLIDFTEKVICHYRSAQLTDEQRAFLVRATESGAWVEPLVSYLDGRLNYTEVHLLNSSYFLHFISIWYFEISRIEIKH